jgi:drug/metabolite transporter (DMT)-like permease
VYFVVDPKFASVSRGDICAISSALSAGLAFVVIRELRKTESAVAVFLSLCVAGTVIAGVMVAVQGIVWPDAVAWAILLSMAVVATVAQLLQTYSLRFIAAGEGTLLAMTAVVYSSVAGIFLFREPFSLHVAVGAVLVLASASYLGMRQNSVD